MISNRASSEDAASASVKANTPDVGFVANILGQDEPSASADKVIGTDAQRIIAGVTSAN